MNSTNDKDAGLLRAAINGDADSTLTLLDQGANPNVTDKNGLTALMWAAGNGYSAIALALLPAGAGSRASAMAE